MDNNWRDLYREVRNENLDAYHAVVETVSALAHNEGFSTSQAAAVEVAMMKLMRTFL